MGRYPIKLALAALSVCVFTGALAFVLSRSIAPSVSGRRSSPSTPEVLSRAMRSGEVFEIQRASAAVLDDMANTRHSVAATQQFTDLLGRTPADWAVVLARTDDPLRHGSALEAWLYQELADRAIASSSAVYRDLFRSLRPADRTRRPDHPWWSAAVGAGLWPADSSVASCDLDGTPIAGLAWQSKDELVVLSQGGTCGVFHVSAGTTTVLSRTGRAITQLKNHDIILGITEGSSLALTNVSNNTITDCGLLVGAAHGPVIIGAAGNTIVAAHSEQVRWSRSKPFDAALGISDTPTAMCVVENDDGDYAVVVGHDSGAIECVALGDEQTQWRAPRQTGPCYAIASRDDLVAAGSSTGVELLGIRRGETRGRIALPTASVRSIVFIDQHRIAVGSDVHGVIWIGDCGRQSIARCIYMQSTGVCRLAYSRGVLASGGYDGRTHIWSID